MLQMIRNLLWFPVLLLGLGTSHAGIIRVDPSLSGREISTFLNRAQGGDTVLFLEGTYRGPYILQGVHGKENLPVVILGSGNKASVIDGQTAPGMNQKQYAFHLKDCSWITIENMDIRNCWTDLIRAEDVSYLSVRHCRLREGKRALFATGRGSHHFLMEHCTWEQDERVWSHAGDFSWDEIHHGIHRHYNGSLFQGSGISGVFVLRDNLIRNTFNAFRLSQINDGEFDPLACTNGEIYRNTIINTSDNVLEPEVHTKNLHYYHNRMVNGHAFISITEVGGGEIYIYGNTAVSLPESEDGWTIFKISSRERALSLPLYIYNNSWHVDFDIIGSPRNIWQNNHIRHFNNAAVATASDSFGIYNLGMDNQFDYDCSNLPFPDLLTRQGLEKHGMIADPLFRDAFGGDFRLEEGSPCIDRGIFKEGLIRSFAGAAPDIGAYDNGMLVEGPPFRYVAPDAEVPYKEMPRITRHKMEGKLLRIWFSVPLDADDLDRISFRLGSGGKETACQVKELTEEGHCLILAPAVDPGTGGAYKLLLSEWPKGVNGMAATGWASTLPVACQKQPLETTRLIADKIIRETSFDTRLAKMEFNGGLTGFSLDGCPVQQEDTWYAYGKIRSDTDTAGHLGLAYEGKITLMLNGVEIFRGSSDSLIVSEYTYNRYRFQEKIPVRWKEGMNEMVVRCEAGSAAVSLLMLPLDELDAMPGHLTQLPLSEEHPYSYWIVNGPWYSNERATGQSDPADSSPESGFQEAYRSEEGYKAWQIPKTPLLRELVIPKSSSYTRDPYSDWHYANGGTMLGMLTLYEVTGDQNYLDFVRQYAANVVENMEYFRWQYRTMHAMRGSFHRLFRMTMLDDSGGPALPFAELQRKDPEGPDYRELLYMIQEHVLGIQERLPDGTLSRPEPEAATVWADDLFMSVPFLLRMAEITGDKSLYDEVTRQVISFNNYLSDPVTGLYFHGWYHNRQVNTPVRWGRANGWIIWATSEALMYLPENHPGRSRVLEIYRNHMEALARFQDPSGLWHQVLDQPETFQETSCTAMFTLGLARGVRMGWLKEEYRESALRGWSALQEKIGPDGTVSDICRGTGIGEDVDFYQQRARFEHDPRGLGAMLTAGCEIQLLEDQ